MNTPARTLLLIILALVCFWLGISTGSTDMGATEVMRVLAGNQVGLGETLLFEIRLPRAISAFTVGGLLALSGMLLQALLRNPLADPYVLGVSGGASVGALTALMLGLGMVITHVSAFVGAMVSMLLVFGLGRLRGSGDILGLVLTGVIVAAGWGALISLLLVVSPDTNIQGMLFWLMGDLGQALHYQAALVLLLVGLAVAWLLARPLNLLVRGEQIVAALGTHPVRLRIAVYFLASILTGAAVSLGGNIAFIGLVTPHLLRLAGSNDHRLLVPHCVLLGGSLLLLSDTIARSVVAPQQLPVGIVTALIGIPLFLFLLLKSRPA